MSKFKIGDRVESERGIKLIEKHAPTIVIYPKGTDTIAILKDGNKVVKSAKAMCNPTDTYDFNIGAKLAFERLMGEEVKQPKADGNFTVRCVKDHMPGDYLTAGKIYSFIDGRITYDSGLRGCEYSSFKQYKRENTNLGACLILISDEVKEVKRTARAGEYIKVVDARDVPCTNNKPEYKNGDILKVISASHQARYANGSASNSFERVLNTEEYVVLENYKPN
jgi:hypothetical protein